MRAELIPDAGGPPIPITRDITVIGRREYCDIQLDDPSLSKRHCVLVKTDGLLMVRDLATTNGTRVKGQMIRWAALLPNDRLALGKLKFRVFLGPDEAPGPGASNSASAPASNKARRSSREARPASPAPRSAAVAPAPPASAPAHAGIPLDVDDSRWFDRMGAADAGEEIIDLD